MSGQAEETPTRVPAIRVSICRVTGGEAMKGQHGAWCPGVCREDVGAGRREGLAAWEAMKMPSLPMSCLRK